MFNHSYIRVSSKVYHNSGVVALWKNKNYIKIIRDIIDPPDDIDNYIW